MNIRYAEEKDFESIIALNSEVVLETSAMNLKKIYELFNLSDYFCVMEIEEEVAAFVIAMRENTLYSNDNYSWFSSRYKNFLYIDRIVVGSNFINQGIGRRMYDCLISYASNLNLHRVVCEYNLEPLNERSRMFHKKLGFIEVGRQPVSHGTKLVSLQERKIKKN